MAKPLRERVLALTGSFETGLLPPLCFSVSAGNFDGQGISFGALQFNFGQGTLQKILNHLRDAHPDVLKEAFGSNCGKLLQILNLPQKEQVAWANSITRGRSLLEPWASAFKALGAAPECQAAQAEVASWYYQQGMKYVEEYGLWSERAVALMFDIAVQNGSIKPSARSKIAEELSRISGDKNAVEFEKLKLIANKVAEASNPRWVEDVRKRKLCIAYGSGIVHGKKYNLKEQFDIDLVDFKGR